MANSSPKPKLKKEKISVFISKIELPNIQKPL
jgi:hypothetical protein